MTAADQTASGRILCPRHQIPDCSPLLNGCSRVIKMQQKTAADQTPATERGLESRYSVERLGDQTGKHDACRYFVLDPQHDPLAVDALRTYSRAARPEYPALADDLDAWVGQTPATDSERVEKTLRVHAYRIAYETPGSTVFGCWGCDWQGDSSSIATHQADMLAVAVVNPLLTLLAEQAATIERLHNVGTGVIPHLYLGGCPTGPPFSSTKRDRDCPACTALGSQRTEGHRG